MVRRLCSRTLRISPELSTDLSLVCIPSLEFHHHLYSSTACHSTKPLCCIHATGQLTNSSHCSSSAKYLGHCFHCSLRLWCAHSSDPTKYLGFELGALTKIDQTNHKYIINGHRSADELADVLDSFIQRYVLCQKCRNPETVLHIKGETITAQCKACGRASPIDMAHKLSTFILRNPPEKAEVPASYVFILGSFLFDEGRVAREKKEEGRLAKCRKRKSLQAMPKSGPSILLRRLWKPADVNCSELTTDWARRMGRKRRLSLNQPVYLGSWSWSNSADGSTALVLEEGKNPIPAIQKYFATSPDPKVCVQVVQNAAGKVRWTDTQTVKAVMASLFDSANIRNDFYKKCELLAPVCFPEWPSITSVSSCRTPRPRRLSSIASRRW